MSSGPQGSPAVSSSISSICATYRDGFDLIQRIKAKRKARKLLRKDCPQNDESTDDLERSLGRGDSTVQSEYDRDVQRLGDRFASGDQTGREALKGINVHLQQQVISRLKLHWQRDAWLDFSTLQDVSDSAQERCILAMMQLQQRLISSGPFEDISPPPLNINNNYQQRPLPAAPPPETPPGDGDWGFEFAKPRSLTPPAQNAAPATLEWSAQSTFAPPIANGTTKRPSPPSTSSGIKSVPLVAMVSPETLAQQNVPARDASLGHFPDRKSTSPVETISHHRDGSKASDDSGTKVDGQYKPLATTTEKVGFFGIRKKKVEMIPDMHENPLVDKYLNEAIEDETRSLRRGSVSTSISNISPDPEETSIFPWKEKDDDTASILTNTTAVDGASRERKDSLNPLSNHRSKSSTNSAKHELLSSSRPLASISAQDLLPNELNNYAGFCKGAWRQQIGDKKKAMEERVKPGSMYNTMKYWQCRQCKFEGRWVAPASKKANAYDMRIAKLFDGVQFRWEFLFKSHIAATQPVTDPAKGTYGCMFCCAEGRGTPMFEGVVSFVRHLAEHRDRLPTGDVLYRMNCLVGRQAAADEDFDVNIMSKEGGLF